MLRNLQANTSMTAINHKSSIRAGKTCIKPNSNSGLLGVLGTVVICRVSTTVLRLASLIVRMSYAFHATKIIEEKGSRIVVGSNTGLNKTARIGKIVFDNAHIMLLKTEIENLPFKI